MSYGWHGCLRNYFGSPDSAYLEPRLVVQQSAITVAQAPDRARWAAVRTIRAQGLRASPVREAAPVRQAPTSKGARSLRPALPRKGAAPHTTAVPLTKAVKA